MEIKENGTQIQAVPMRHKMDLQGWKKTHWVGCGDLNDWIILTIWFQTVIHSAGQLLKLNFLLEMIDGYSLLQWYPSPTQATERAEWFSWSLTGGQVSQIAFSLILVCVLVHLPVLIPHLPWGLGISQQLQISYEPVRQTDILINSHTWGYFKNGSSHHEVW